MERPILFSAPMVQAILAGTKTQTRRVVKPTPGRQSEWLTHELISEVPHGEMINGGWQMHHPKAGTRYPYGFGTDTMIDEPYDSPLGWIKCPYGVPGTKLWVRETWQTHVDMDHVRPSELPVGTAIQYPATYDHWVSKKRPSIFLPRWASRITLEIESVRVERLQDISEEDARAEGAPVGDFRQLTVMPDSFVAQASFSGSSYRSGFGILWDKINGKTHPWESNPWLWVISFRRIEQ